MFYWLIPLIIGAVFLAVFLYFRVKEKRVIAVIFKSVTSMMFIATALVAWLTSNNPMSMFGVFIVLGLFFGLLGDVFLDLKFILLDNESLYTILGFCTFGIGHIFYVTGLFLNFFNFSVNVLYIIIPVIVAIILMIVTLLMEKFTNIKYEKMKPFVLVYGFILFFTTSIYFSASIQTGWQSMTVVIMSMSLIIFALSDLILNNTYFAPGFATPAFIISNHVFYYVAQFAIASSLFFLI